MGGNQVDEMKHIYELRDIVKKKLETQGYSMVCRYCKKPLEVGSLVLSSRNVKYFKICHLECFNATFVDI
jgi:hypothetical protein